VAQLETDRDAELPLKIAIRERQLAAYRDWAARGPEQARQAQDRIFGLENALKRLRGYRDALSAPALLEAKRADEASLRARVAARADLAAEAGEAWDAIAAAQQDLRERNAAYQYRTTWLGGRLLGLASHLLRYAIEIAKPDGERLEEYRDARRPSLCTEILSPAPIYLEMEEAVLAVGIAECRRALGDDDRAVRAALDGRSPEDAAHAAVAGTRLSDVAVRERILREGPGPFADDPLLAFALRLEDPYLEMRAWYEDHVESVETLRGGQIARARFALDGRSTYPDATGTLRLSYGRVAGYEQLSTLVPWKTTFHGLYDRADSFDRAGPFRLAPRVEEARGQLDLSTPLDFVTTNDITGGNSGSPVLDRDGDLVGLVFDGNIQAFSWEYSFDDVQGRTVAVHAAAIVHALRRIYGMDALADELEGRSRAAP
jgi:hypothetical protein